MSEGKKKEERKERFDFNIAEEDKLPFAEIGEFKFSTSSDFGKLVGELFKVFDDFYNIKYVPAKTVNGTFYEPSFTVAFKNNVYEVGTNIIHGVDPAQREIETGGDYVQLIQSIDNKKANAGKFVATENLKDILEKYLSPIYFNQGKINWGQVCRPVADPIYGNPYGGNRYIQCTSFVGLSARKFAYLFYKKTDVDAKYLYMINQGNNQQIIDNFGRPINMDNYTLQICRTNVKNVDELMKYYGVNNNNGWIFPTNN